MPRVPQHRCGPDCPVCEEYAQMLVDPGEYDSDAMADIEADRYERNVLGL